MSELKAQNRRKIEQHRAAIKKLERAIQLEDHKQKEAAWLQALGNLLIQKLSPITDAGRSIGSLTLDNANDAALIAALIADIDAHHEKRPEPPQQP
ncbi:MAG: hypothetical protein RBQ99_02950 [Trichlorobacter sp.]|jgi:hypothetical protein|nr:hypothetical protein [Trichlorobacter sp.]